MGSIRCFLLVLEALRIMDDVKRELNSYEGATINEVCNMLGADHFTVELAILELERTGGAFMIGTEDAVAHGQKVLRAKYTTSEKMIKTRHLMEAVKQVLPANGSIAAHEICELIGVKNQFAVERAIGALEKIEQAFCVDIEYISRDDGGVIMLPKYSSSKPVKSPV